MQTPYLPTASDQSRIPEHLLIRTGCLSGHRPSGVRLPPFPGPVLHPAGLFNLQPVQGRRVHIQRGGDGHPHTALEPVWTLYEESWGKERRRRPSSRVNTIHPTRRKMLPTAQQRDPSMIMGLKLLRWRTYPPLGLHKKICRPHSLLQVRNDIRYPLQ